MPFGIAVRFGVKHEVMPIGITVRFRLKHEVVPIGIALRFRTKLETLLSPCCHNLSDCQLALVTNAVSIQQAVTDILLYRFAVFFYYFLPNNATPNNYQASL